MISLTGRRMFAITPAFAAHVDRTLGLLSAEREKPGAWCTWLDEARPSDLYTVIDGVAVITVRGVLVDRLEYHGGEWATGYNAIRLACEMARHDPDVRVIVLDIDSGGGMVAGCFELCQWIRALDKTTVALVTNWSASAAYALAASCRAITAPITGGVGSIGVVMMHMDMSRWLEDIGLKVTLIHAGAHKVDGNPFDALPDSVKTEWQETCEAYRRMFAEHVAAGRGIGVDQVLATEARFYEGPVQMRRALSLKLLDRIVSPDDALAALVEDAAAAA